MVLGQVDIHKQKNYFGPLTSQHIKIHSKWIIYLKVRAKTIKLLGENKGVNLHDLGFRQWFLRYNMKDISYKRKNKLDIIKI